MARHAPLASGLAALAAAAALATAPVPAAAAAPLDPTRVTWKALHFEATKLIFSGTTDVRFETVTREDLAAALIESPQGTARLPRGETLLLAVDSAFAGRKEEDRVWFEPADGSALQRFKVRHGKKAYGKTYRFADSGVHSRRTAPRDGEAALAPASWTDVHEDFYAHPAQRCECSAILEPAVLFYLVATADLDRPIEVCAFTRRALSRVRLQAGATEKLWVDYSERSPRGERRRRGEVDALKLSIRASPVDSQSEDEFELLGLKGDVEIYLDPRTRVPLQVSGRVPVLGTVHVKLVEVELAE